MYSIYAVDRPSSVEPHILRSRAYSFVLKRILKFGSSVLAKASQETVQRPTKGQLYAETEGLTQHTAEVSPEASNSRKSRKWSNDENTDIMGAFFRSTNCGRNKQGVRKQMMTEAASAPLERPPEDQNDDETPENTELVTEISENIQCNLETMKEWTRKENRPSSKDKAKSENEKLFVFLNTIPLKKHGTNHYNSHGNKN